MSTPTISVLLVDESCQQVLTIGRGVVVSGELCLIRQDGFECHSHVFMFRFENRF
jgi:hypothetical protein